MVGTLRFAHPTIPPVVMPRHRVSPSASPMTGSGGASSTPRLLGSIIAASGILGHPPSRVTTSEGVLAARFRPRFCKFGAPLLKRGRRECRVHAAPAVSCANCAKKAHTSIQGSGGSPTSPAQWLYGLLRALPGERALLPPSLADRSASLTPASRRQDHTTSPYALAFSSARCESH
jgi:hypothetical protein